MMKDKCVFFLVPSMHTGGQERVVSRLTTILKDDYNVKVILYNDKIIGYPIDCEYFCLKLPETRFYHSNEYYQTIRRIIKYRKLKAKYKPFASISFGLNANIVNVLSSSRKSKTIISIHGYSTIKKLYRKGIKAWVVRFILKQSKMIICVSKVMAKEVKEILGLGDDRVCVVYNACDLKEIKAFTREKTELDDWFAGNKVIINIGMIRPEKGLWHLIKALYVVTKKEDSIKLLHVGLNQSEDGEKIKKLIRDLGLENNVMLLGHKTNPFKYCAKSKVFVLSSVSEGFPNVLVEAMASGVPVIAADCKTGPRDILSPENLEKSIDGVLFADYGILVPPLNEIEDYDPEIFDEGEELLAEAMLKLLNDPKLEETYALKGEQRAAEFSYEKCREQIIHIIES